MQISILSVFNCVFAVYGQFRPRHPPRWPPPHHRLPPHLRRRQGQGNQWGQGQGQSGGQGSGWNNFGGSSNGRSGSGTFTSPKTQCKPRSSPRNGRSYEIVGTGLNNCYNNYGKMKCPSRGQAFYGQDAQKKEKCPSYKDNKDGTITDLNTGLMWQKNPGKKVTLSQAHTRLSSVKLGGYKDWRIPTIKELYSLINFNGKSGRTVSQSVPYIDTNYFKFTFGNEHNGERLIDAQALTKTIYVSTTMNGDRTMFGVNFADGRIKGYPLTDPRSRRSKTFLCYYVRGSKQYGRNKFKPNGDGTVTDKSTGLMWTQGDSGHLKAGPERNGKLNWQEALKWAKGLNYAGYSNWRLPTVKELQSIVDYGRSPATTGSPAVDPVFRSSVIRDEGGKKNYPFYWTSTTHLEGRPESRGYQAAYVAFGESLGFMNFGGRGYTLLDVHGAGSQRSDPKTGDPDDYPYGHGPQGDVIRIYNHARLVRNV